MSLIGAPTDVGAADRGASMGPEAMRVAGLQRALEARGLAVVDRGNLAGPGNPNGPPVGGYRHLAEVTNTNLDANGFLRHVRIDLHVLDPSAGRDRSEEGQRRDEPSV